MKLTGFIQCDPVTKILYNDEIIISHVTLLYNIEPYNI